MKKNKKTGIIRMIGTIVIVLGILFLSELENKIMTNKEIVKNNHFKKIADIPEASGICFIESSNTFLVVNDEGILYEIDSKGKILRKKVLGKYDFEGIVCDEKNSKIYLLIEDTGHILSVSMKNFKIENEIVLDISKEDKKKYFNSESGAEGLAMNENTIYISTQNKSHNLLEFVFSKDEKELKLKKIHNVKSSDLSGMTYYKKQLYILSDKNNSIYVYNIKKEKIEETIKLEKGKWEGIIFDKKGQLYLADDAGSVVKYNIVK